MLPSVVPRLATDSAVRVFPGVWKLLSFLRLPSLDGAPSLTLLSLFLSFIFFLPPFKDNGLLFWVPDVLCWHSKVVLWNLLSIQMFFWWICGRESDLPVLFFCHLRTTSNFVLFLNSIILLLKERKYWKIMLGMSCNWCEMSTILKECGWAERPSITAVTTLI